MVEDDSYRCRSRHSWRERADRPKRSHIVAKGVHEQEVSKQTLTKLSEAAASSLTRALKVSISRSFGLMRVFSRDSAWPISLLMYLFERIGCKSEKQLTCHKKGATENNIKYFAVTW